MVDQTFWSRLGMSYPTWETVPRGIDRASRRMITTTAKACSMLDNVYSLYELKL